MVSPARRHFQRTLAASAGQQAAKAAKGITALPMPETGAVATEYQTLLAALGIDLNALREIQSTERKIEAKRAMIEKYRDWAGSAATAWLAGDVPSTQDDIVTTMTIWAIDIQDWPFALLLATYVIRGHLDLPGRYERSAATFVAEEVAEAAIANIAAVPLSVLQEVEELVADADIFDQVRAKLEKALGLAFIHAADTFDADASSAPAGGKPALLANAASHFTRAVALHDSCGAKTPLRNAERALKKLNEDKAASEASGMDSPDKG